jgi:DNA-binding response OmpR family regulator
MNDVILVAEDDPAILAGVTDLLSLEGYSVEKAENGEMALQRFRDLRPRPALVLLDVMMPKMSGYDVCRAIRREDPATPILMLTAKGEEIDKVIGLELGADDYIVKPFGMAELMARVHSALRRAALTLAPSPEASAAQLQLGDTLVDFASLTGRRGGVTFSFTPKELAFLRCLAENEGKAVSRETLLETVWGLDCDVTTRSIDQHMVRLRQKLEDDPARPRFLHTVHGVGYRLTRGAPQKQ